MKDRKILLEVGDGPEGITIYTSDEEAIRDWGRDIPGLYIQASIMGADFKIGPFQLKSIREGVEAALKV
jgi:hypothetical protein